MGPYQELYMLNKKLREIGQKTFTFTTGVKAFEGNFIKNLASLQWPLLSLAPASNPKDGHQSLHLGPLLTLRIFWKIWAPPSLSP